MDVKNLKEFFFYYVKMVYIKYSIFIQNINLHKIPNLPQKTNKRILFIPSDNNKSSGAFLCLVSLCDFLINKYGLDVFVILPIFGSGKQLLDAKNIPYCTINSFGWGIELSRVRDDKCEKEIYYKKLLNEGAIKKIREFIRINDVDLVHINTSYTYVGAIAAQNENIPFIWHIRELLEKGQNNTMWDRKIGNELINTANKVITISNSVRDKYSEFIDNDRLITIYDGVEVEKFYNPHKEIFEENIIKIIFVGYISEYKGIYDFCDACIKLYTSKFKNFEVMIVGSGESHVVDEIKSNFIDAGMERNVSFLGFQKDVAKFLTKSDIFCMCTQWEAFGRTTVEAMLSGNLVIGANSGGTKDIINDGVTGILYTQGNSENLYEKLYWAIQNKLKCKEIAKSGRDYIFNNMSAEKNADEIYKLYNEIFNSLNS